MQIPARLASSLLCTALTAAASTAQTRVLVLSSGNPALDTTVEATLDARGLDAAIGPEHTGFTSAVSLNNVDVVYLQANFNGLAGDMPLDGQQHLLDFVNGGGGLVVAGRAHDLAWSGWFEVLSPAFAATNDGTNTDDGTVALSVVQPDPVMTAGLPGQFAVSTTPYFGTESRLIASVGATIFLTSDTSFGRTVIDGIGRTTAATDAQEGLPTTKFPDGSAFMFTVVETVAPFDGVLRAAQIVGFDLNGNSSPWLWDYTIYVWDSWSALNASPLNGNVATLHFDEPTFPRQEFGIPHWQAHDPHTYLLTFDLSTQHVPVVALRTYIVGFSVTMVPVEGYFRASTTLLEGPEAQIVTQSGVYPAGSIPIGTGRIAIRVTETVAWTTPIPAVVGRAVASGRTVSFSTFNGEAQFLSPDFGQLLANSMNWAAGGAATCYPDCNSDGALNLSDFGCFQTKFALGDPYADCNGDGVRNLSDFGCFQTRFALGCP